MDTNNERIKAVQGLGRLYHRLHSSNLVSYPSLLCSFSKVLLAMNLQSQKTPLQLNVSLRKMTLHRERQRKPATQFLTFGW